MGVVNKCNNPLYFSGYCEIRGLETREEQGDMLLSSSRRTHELVAMIYTSYPDLNHLMLCL